MKHPPARSPRGRSEASLHLDAAIRPKAGTYDVVVSGDFDSEGSPQFDLLVDSAVRSGLLLSFRLDGVDVFGASASRSVERLLSCADTAGAELAIDGIPEHVGRILDVVGVNDSRIHRSSGPTDAMSPVVFDAVISRGVLHTREAVCITTPDVTDPRIVFVNAAFTKLTGYRADDVLGANPRMLQGDLTERAVIERLKTTVADGGEFTGEAINYRSDGSPFWMNWRVITIDYGSRRYLMALQRDRTRLHQLRRLDAARTGLARAVNRFGEGDSVAVLEALAHAASIVIESRDAAISATLTGDGGDILAANLEGTLTEASEHRMVTTVSATASTINIPFAVSENLHGNLFISGLHRDWVSLIDEGDLVKLCDDVVQSLRLTPVA